MSRGIQVWIAIKATCISCQYHYQLISAINCSLDDRTQAINSSPKHYPTFLSVISSSKGERFLFQFLEKKAYKMEFPDIIVCEKVLSLHMTSISNPCVCSTDYLPMHAEDPTPHSPFYAIINKELQFPCEQRGEIYT